MMITKKQAEKSVNKSKDKIKRRNKNVWCLDNDLLYSLIDGDISCWLNDYLRRAMGAIRLLLLLEIMLNVVWKIDGWPQI